MKKTLLEDLNKKYYKVDTVYDLKDLLYNSAKKYPDEYAFKLKDEKGKIFGITYTKFKQDVEALGTSLINMGLKEKPIAIIGKNSYSWAVSYLAATIIGIVVPIDKELYPNDIINFLNVSEANCIIGDSKYLKLLLESKEKINNSSLFFVCTDIKEKLSNVFNFNNLLNDGKILISKGNNSFNNISINPDEMHILLFTSGTTGNAKGVCLSHKNIVSNILSTASTVKVTNKDQLLSILPIHHTYECTLGFLLPIYNGACISYCEGLKYINKNISEFKPTIVLCVPLLLENIYKKLMKILETVLPKKYFETEKHKLLLNNLPFFIKKLIKSTVKKSLGGKLQTFIVGAAAINPIIVDAFSDLGINVLQGYGLTECSPLVAGNNDFYCKSDAVRITNSKC